MDHFQQRLFQRINYERQVKSGTEHFKLQTMQELLDRLGNPHLKYPVVHVAGTKGKGSVSTMVAQILAASGQRVGVYSSPHLETIHQRISINGQPISNSQLEILLEQLFEVVDQMDRELSAIQPCLAGAAGTERTLPINDPGPFTPDAECVEQNQAHPADFRPPTFFEIMTAASMLHFAQQQCDAAVLEVGLGGRLDSTNVCQPEVAVVTNISLDHTRQLGGTLDLIAAEKAGIIKPGATVVSGETKSLPASVIRNVAQQHGCQLFELDRDFRIQTQATTAFQIAGNLGQPFESGELQLPMPGQHQRTNAAIAVAVAEALKQRGWDIPTDAVQSGLASAALPGRTEIVCSNPTVLLDIAHNVASIEALLKTLNDDIPAWQTSRRKTLLFGTSTDKQYRSMLKRLLPEFDRVVFTKYQLNPRGRSTSSLLAAAEDICRLQQLTTTLDVAPMPADGWESTVNGLQADDLVCVAGSVFLIAELRSSALEFAKTCH